ncbi:ABC transporter ATP-binding protein [Limnochorda pilosa]|uniref:Branched-chain amino acid ABC transporter ATP-binding protein n=1 Tax=Limnochorda pilosa TaxID=1555112 RepID=A0A0K2SJM9_LIMPI|nr:ABC transporter ATP-binding protein [Limnochorda pilosa]BAS27212.1 branched-chain amino acid ABC transporter ATP-binding protein [Limnochorda pilosa]
MEPLLSVNNLEVIYDKVFLAVKGISLEVPQGSIVTLLGANGAGKSTTLKAISGLLGPERGEVTRGVVRFAGRPLDRLPSPRRVALGIAQVLEGRRVFEHLTPEENLLAASTMHRDGAHVRSLIDRIYGYFPRLAERRSTRAGYLSGGEQQMLAIGRALMAEPRLLLLDEPSLGLAPRLVQEIFDIVRRINQEEGVTILLVEQNARAALAIASHGYLMENGRIVMAGPARTLRENPDVREFYLGGGSRMDYQRVKHYRRRKRWLA